MANMQNFLQSPNQGISDVPDTDKYTLFVPTDAAFVDIGNEQSLSQDKTMLDQVCVFVTLLRCS